MKVKNRSLHEIIAINVTRRPISYHWSLPTSTVFRGYGKRPLVWNGS